MKKRLIFLDKIWYINIAIPTEDDHQVQDQENEIIFLINWMQEDFLYNKKTKKILKPVVTEESVADLQAQKVTIHNKQSEIEQLIARSQKAIQDQQMWDTKKQEEAKVKIWQAGLETLYKKEREIDKQMAFLRPKYNYYEYEIVVGEDEHSLSNYLSRF